MRLNWLTILPKSPPLEVANPRYYCGLSRMQQDRLPPRDMVGVDAMASPCIQDMYMYSVQVHFQTSCMAMDPADKAS